MGQEAHVNDPVYGKAYIFEVFSIQDDDEKIEFAPGTWRIYTRD